MRSVTTPFAASPTPLCVPCLRPKRTILPQQNKNRTPLDRSSRSQLCLKGRFCFCSVAATRSSCHIPRARDFPPPSRALSSGKWRRKRKLLCEARKSEHARRVSVSECSDRASEARGGYTPRRRLLLLLPCLRSTDLVLTTPSRRPGHARPGACEKAPRSKWILSLIHI